MDLSLPRGIRDIEPEEYAHHVEIRQKFEEVADLFNFKLMEPAPIERLSMLRAKSGTDIDKEIYTFKDKGGRDLGLRFDLTVGLTRYACSRRDLKPPIKLGCMGGAWRYDEPQHARYRWFQQWDLEIFGAASVEADAEIIDASMTIFERLGLANCVAYVGDRRAVQEFITKRLGIESEERAVELMRALDKVEKRTLAGLEEEYVEKGFEPDMLRSLFEFGRLRGPPEKVLERLEEMNLEASAEMGALCDGLKARGLKTFEFNMGVVRGIDYYTAMVFEVADRDHGDLGSLCGGGRYDLLPRILGRPDLPATGAAGGVDREALSLGEKARQRRLVFVATAGPEARSRALKLLAELRSAGVSSEAELQDRPLARQLEDASSAGAGWTIVVGKKEMAQGRVTLKDMKRRTEESLPFGEALDRIMKG